MKKIFRDINLLPWSDAKPSNKLVGDHLPFRQDQHSFIAPDSDDSDPVRIAAVDDTERRADQFAQKIQLEFRHHPAHLRLGRQQFDIHENPAHQSLPDLGNRLFLIVGQDLFKIGQGRGGKE